MRDVMVDIETLGTAPGSVTLSIGAVAFDPERGDLGDEFYRVISIASSLRWRAAVDAKTVTWWKDRSPAAQAVVFEALAGGSDLSAVLGDFADWLGRQHDPKALRLWGNGSDFDNVHLAAGYALVNQPLPWRFFNNRCFRTLKNLFPGREPKRVGEHHHALDDARHQALHALAILKDRRAL